jgi:hypothetical protein
MSIMMSRSCGSVARPESMKRCAASALLRIPVSG